MQIALIDYGAGNLTSVRKGFSAAGAELRTLSSRSELDNATGIVVPGVGNFSSTAAIDEQWRGAIAKRVEAGVPLFGICLGMQWLFHGSAEAPDVPGLGLISGQCARITAERPLKVPHVGWNALHIMRPSAIIDGVDDGTQVYFTHAFAAPLTPECSASAVHGRAFAAVVQRENIAGVQFHPEKSGPAGLRILRNFVAMTRQ
jgi:glutamine amidotransferase